MYAINAVAVETRSIASSALRGAVTGASINNNHVNGYRGLADMHIHIQNPNMSAHQSQ